MEQIKLFHPLKSLQEQENDTLLTTLVFLTARQEPREAKVGVCFVAKNRYENPRWWGKDFKSVVLVLLAPYTSPENLDLVHFPFKNNVSELWDECFLVVKSFLEGKEENPVDNCDTFFILGEVIPKWIPLRNEQTLFKKIGNIKFYKIELQ